MDCSVYSVAKNVLVFLFDSTSGRVVLGIGVAYTASRMVQYVQRQQRKAEWKERSKNKVILHQFSRGKLSPNISPFCLKLETYLRMANIPYEVDFKDIWGPKEKTPYITVDGEEIADSQLCIQFLGRKFGKDATRQLTDGQRAVGHTLQIMVDEHLFWALRVWQYVHNINCIGEIQNLSGFNKFVFKMIAPRRVGKIVYLQGMGRHTAEEIDEIMAEDLKAISVVLGKKKFLFGEEPCEVDCAVFSQLVQVLWNSPGSKSVYLCDAELPNLREYCIRMKKQFWQDWEMCLNK